MCVEIAVSPFTLFPIDALQTEVISVNFWSVKVTLCLLKFVQWVVLRGEVPLSLPFPSFLGQRKVSEGKLSHPSWCWERIVSQLSFFSLSFHPALPFLLTCGSCLGRALSKTSAFLASFTFSLLFAQWCKQQGKTTRTSHPHGEQGERRCFDTSSCA